MAGDHLPFLDEHHPIAGNFYFAEDVRVQKNGRAAFALSANHIAHQPPPHGIQSRGGLIKKNQFRLVNQRLRQADALQHSFGKVAQAFFAMGSQPYQVPEAPARVRASRSAVIPHSRP